jgi:hypothetical protein
MFYLNAFSHHKIVLVEKYLLELTDGEIGYTFDAGSHCFLIVPEHHELTVLAFFRWLYRDQELAMNESAKLVAPQKGEFAKAEQMAERAIEKGFNTHLPKKLILSKVGDDPITYNGEWV